ncbi:hypothetical protein ASPZODRAFT_15488 [Penicilliopsis zonata CBS 506.65]|uniref:CFEM domain-containing protein n=1 Tax=Penicilliopsis zonata CBS 506.65 TaxID=1073090 RepID=A0A1L9SL97_9EURO|nr:hypothetical protein ASPZODRAFT_15488 [Penicilliopsis zonata CBS 506.65]OJJ48042.1 hypothetical protein ASPZODRAFT_15488 [Penicilliopsis zonata CBS 506.65]
MKFTILAFFLAMIASAYAWSECMLECAEAAASSAGCSSNYNATSCMCDNTVFMTDVKACLYGDCKSDVTTFFSFRSGICYSTSTTTASSDSSTSTSSSSSSSSSSSGSSGLSHGAQAGIAVGCIVGGGLVSGMAVYFFLRRRKSKKEQATREAEERLPEKDTASRRSSVTV